MIGALFQAYLAADVTIAGLVATRIYPLRLPQKPTLPALVLLKVSTVPVEVLRGAPSADQVRYQVDAWAPTHLASLTLGAAVRARLDGFVGAWTDTASPANSVAVSVRFLDARDLFEEEVSGGLCRHSADYVIVHGRAGGAV